MRFSPYKDPENPSFSDSESEDDATPSISTHSPFLSSPLKSMLESTPTKPSNSSPLNRKEARTHDVRKRYTSLLYSSPLHQGSNDILLDSTPSPVKTKASLLNDTNDDANLDPANDTQELIDLLEDLEIKERLGLMSAGSVHSETSSGHTKTHNKRNGINMSIKVNFSSGQHTTPVKKKTIQDDEVLKENDHSQLKTLESSVIDAFESRLNQRNEQVEQTIEALRREKARIERERKEAEARRLAEEKRKVEEEKEKERLRKEEEARKLKLEQEEKKRKEEQQKKEQEAAQLKKKQDEELRLKEQEEAKKAATELSKKQTKGVTNFATIDTKFHAYKRKIAEIKSTIVEPVKADSSLKKIISQHKRKINPKFGQLTNSLSQLTKISNELSQLINQTKPEPLAYKWILNFVSKAIVSQAETEVRAKPSSSIPLAKLTLNLLCEFSELKEYLLARFIKKCPYIIGHSVQLTNNPETFQEMAWRKHEGTWESQVSYDERMAGITTLFFVITRLPVDQKYYATHKHPLSLTNAWVFIARMLNTPKDRITSTHYVVASSWWEACAREMLMNYGKQGTKVLQTIWRDWCALKENEGTNFPGANTLRTMGEDWEKEGELKSFPEMEG